MTKYNSYSKLVFKNFYSVIFSNTINNQIFDIKGNSTRNQESVEGIQRTHAFIDLHCRTFN